MRTLEKGKSMSYGIANKVGFEQIPNAYQIIERERIDGSIQAATNIILDIDLRNLNKEKLKKEIENSAIIYKKVEESALDLLPNLVKSNFILFPYNLFTGSSDIFYHHLKQ